jgi:hypothetical protein
MAYVNHKEFLSNVGFTLQSVYLLRFFAIKHMNNCNLKDLLQVKKAGTLTL